MEFLVWTYFSQFDFVGSSIYIMEVAKVNKLSLELNKMGLTRQLLVGEEDEVLYFKLPGAKKKQNKHKHDIMDAVDNARGAEKKH